jgi:hypothetical protein
MAHSGERTAEVTLGAARRSLAGRVLVLAVCARLLRVSRFCVSEFTKLHRRRFFIGRLLAPRPARVRPSAVAPAPPPGTTPETWADMAMVHGGVGLLGRRGLGTNPEKLACMPGSPRACRGRCCSHGTASPSSRPGSTPCRTASSSVSGSSGQPAAWRCGPAAAAPSPARSAGGRPTSAGSRVAAYDITARPGLKASLVARMGARVRAEAAPRLARRPSLRLAGLQPA